MEIKTQIEARRGCGYRKPGGYYLVSSDPPKPCGGFPFPLTACRCCGAGIKPARGFTWISQEAFPERKCTAPASVCLGGPCPAWRNAKMGLIWVGESFYKTPSAFLKEWQTAGISRRLGRIPKEFKVGETAILLAHRKAISVVSPDGAHYQPGAFAIFTPQRIEYIVTGKETEAQLERLVARGFTLVKVIRDIDAQTSILSNPEFVIRYSITVDGTPYGYPGESVEVDHVYHIKAADQERAKEQFLEVYPMAKIKVIKHDFEKLI